MDALASIVTLLKPRTIGTKLIRGGGRWAVKCPPIGQPGFALMLEGACHLALDGFPETTLETGDFVLYSAMPGFLMGSDLKVKPTILTPPPDERKIRDISHGDPTKAPTVKMLGGHFLFDPVNAPVLLDFLPGILKIRASDPSSGMVAAVMDLVQNEAREDRPGRDLVLARLIDILLVEAIRSSPGEPAERGLLAGLREPRLAASLRGIHTDAARPWTLAMLAREAGMSRSSFAEAFARVIGATPLNYLLMWRLALAKHLMVHEQKTVAEAALAVGYESASGFSTAFSREIGMSPRDFTAAHRSEVA